MAARRCLVIGDDGDDASVDMLIVKTKAREATNDDGDNALLLQQLLVVEAIQSPVVTTQDRMRNISCVLMMALKGVRHVSVTSA
jgi:hypothetical protein